MILSTFKNYLRDNSSYRVAHLARLELSFSTESSPAFYYVTDANIDITWGGNVYSKGKILSLGTLKATEQVSSYTLALTMAGEDENELARALIDSSSSSYIGKSVQILKAYLDEDDHIIPAESSTNGPLIYFEGQIQSLSIKDTPGKSSIITWNLVNHWTVFNKGLGRLTKDSVHRALDASGNTVVSALKDPYFNADLGFVYADSVNSITTQYQTEVTKTRLIEGRKNLYILGIKSGSYKTYTSQEYKEWVTNSIELNLKLNARYLPVVYGVRPVEGIPVFAEVLKKKTTANYVGSFANSSVFSAYSDILNKIDNGSKNPFLVVVYALCEGKVTGLMDIKMAGNPMVCLNSAEAAASADGSGRFCIGNLQTLGSTLISGSNQPIVHSQAFNLTEENISTSITFYDGRLDQAAASFLTGCNDNGMFLNGSSWTANHRLSGTSYAVCIFEMGESRTDLPELEFVVNGIDHDYPGHKSYSSTFSVFQTNNPIVHLRDYLTNPIYGLGVPNQDIDDESFFASAQYAAAQDSSYNSSFLEGYSNYLGYSSPINAFMQQNLKLDTSETGFNNLKILTNFWGLVLNRTNGKYTLLVKGNESSVDGTIDFGKDIIGDIGFTDNTDKNKRNSMSATITDPLKNWSDLTIPMFNGTYLEEDNFVPRSENFSFNAITNYYCARTWVKRILDESRFSKEIDITVSLRYNYLVPGSLIYLTYSRFGWNSKIFRVTSLIKRTQDISLTLSEYNSSIYFPQGNQPFEVREQINLLPTVASVTNITWVDANQPLINLNGVLSWDPAISSGVSHYLVSWADGVTNTIGHPRGSNTKVNLNVTNRVSGNYTINIITVDLVGNKSRPVAYSFVMGNTPEVLKTDGDLAPYIEDTETSDWVIKWNPSVKENGALEPTYIIQFYINSTNLREETVNGFSFTYTKAMNLSDYSSTNAGAIGVNRLVSIRVKPLNGLVWSYL